MRIHFGVAAGGWQWVGTAHKTRRLCFLCKYNTFARENNLNATSARLKCDLIAYGLIYGMCAGNLGWNGGSFYFFRIDMRGEVICVIFY